MEREQSFSERMEEIMNCLFYVAIVGAVVIGYGLNIYKLAFENPTAGMLAARVIGIFAFPLGAVLGWF